MFLDPTRTEGIEQGGRVFPMAADLTTPLASRLAQGPIQNYEYLGVFDPEFYDDRAGVYAVDPYQPGKVPVVFVHGLWSSPTAWVPMLDALRGDPALRLLPVLGRALSVRLFAADGGSVRPALAPGDPPSVRPSGYRSRPRPDGHRG